MTFRLNLILSFFLVLYFSVSARADADPSSFWQNEKAIRELKDEKVVEAQQKILGALGSNPFESRLHLNLGLTFEMMEQPDKAKASYEQALKLAHDDDEKFAANYNLGQIAQKAKKVDEALSYYQEALRFQPDSKETKTNIELLIQDQQSQNQNQKQDPNQENNDGQGQGDQQKESQDDQNQKDQKKEEPKQDQPQQVQKNKPQPKKFKSEELNQADANKILGEIKQQEQKIRAEFNRKEVKERPRDKDW